MPEFAEDFYSRRQRPARLTVDQKLDLLLEWMKIMSQGFTDLTAAVADLTGAVSDESDVIAKNTDAINTENASITGATDELTSLVKQLLAAQDSGDDAAAETAAQAIEAQIAKMKTSSTAIATNTTSIATSTGNLNTAVSGAQQAAAGAAPPPPGLLIAGTLVDAVAGQPYTGAVAATGGVGSLTITAQGLPDGLAVDASGNITGTPSTPGESDVIFTVTDQSTPNPQTASTTIALDVEQAAAPPAPPPPNSPPPPPPPPAPSPIDADPSESFQGTVGAPFSDQLGFTGGAGNLQFSIQGGALPDGLTLNGGGLITGTPTTAGTSTVTIQAHDANSDVGSGAYEFVIAEASAGGA